MSEHDEPSTIAFERARAAGQDGWVSLHGTLEHASGELHVVRVSAHEQHSEALERFAESLRVTARVTPAGGAAPPPGEPGGASDEELFELQPADGPLIVAQIDVTATLRADVLVGIDADQPAGVTVHWKSRPGARVSLRVTIGRVRFRVQRSGEPDWQKEVGAGESTPDIKSDGHCSVTAMKRCQYFLSSGWVKD